MAGDSWDPRRRAPIHPLNSAAEEGTPAAAVWMCAEGLATTPIAALKWARAAQVFFATTGHVTDGVKKGISFEAQFIFRAIVIAFAVRLVSALGPPVTRDSVGPRFRNALIVSTDLVGVAIVIADAIHALACAADGPLITHDVIAEFALGFFSAFLTEVNGIVRR